MSKCLDYNVQNRYGKPQKTTYEILDIVNKKQAQICAEVWEEEYITQIF